MPGGLVTGSMEPMNADKEVLSENKQKMLAALQAKKERQGESHIDADPNAGAHAHGPADQKRVFRRKTG